MTLSVAVSPRKVVRRLILAMVCLIIANVVTQIARFSLDSDAVTKFARVFDLSEEVNIPTWYQSTTLLICAMLLAIIVSVHKAEGGRYAFHWLVLALTFLYLSTDEVAALHDRLTDPLRSAFDLGGGFYFAWVIPAGVLVAVFAMAYLKFFLHLLPATRRVVLLAAMLYVGGALGMEVVSGFYADSFGTANLGYELLTTVEETFEMSGVIAFMYALLIDLEQYVHGEGGAGREATGQASTTEPGLRSATVNRVT